MTSNIYVGDEEISRKQPIIIGIDKTCQVKAGENINFQVHWSYQEASRKKKEEWHFYLEVFRNGLSLGSGSKVAVGRYRRFDRGEGFLTVTTTSPTTIGLYAYRCSLKCENMIGAWERGIPRGKIGRIMAPSEYELQEKAEKDIAILLDVYSIWSQYFLSIKETR